jgi:hypothetical protein
MIANFFQSLSGHGVEHLLISGQASILYGAATFSEDIDLWLDPTAENCARFVSALRDCRARYYKLTPPLTPEHLTRGHGLHFVLSGREEPEIFLDILGAPPRLESFGAAAAGARWMETDWGRLHTIGVKDLVELKKTQRLEDYPIISNLALAWFDQPQCARVSDDFVWALENIFTLSALRSLFEEHPEAATLAAGEQAANLKDFGDHIRRERDVPEIVEEQLSAWMQKRITALQRADRRYWRDIIAELKQLRTAGKLMREGSEV